MRLPHNRQLRRWLPWALHVALVGGLAWAAWAACTPRQSVPGDPGAAATLAAAVRKPALKPSPGTANLEAVTWGRSLRQASAGKAAEAKPPEPVNIDLVGAVLDGENSKAFLKDRLGTVHMKSLNGELDGWQVVEIRETSVVVKKDKRQEELKLKPQP